MIWREPTNHVTDCYFCLVKIEGFSKRNKHKITYPDIPSVSKPLERTDCELPIPMHSDSFENSTDEEDINDVLNVSISSDPTYVPSNEPHLITQSDLNDLIRDLDLTKEKSQILGSRLKEWNLLYSTTRISVLKKRHEKFSSFYKVDRNFCYCTDVNGLLHELSIEYNPAEWRLFIDSSKRSLKAVLLYNGNSKPSIPLAHSTNTKETYDSMSTTLNLIQYSIHLWQICGDLKVISLLLGLQGGFTKYCCFLCLWDSRAVQHHYQIKEWQPRTNFVPGKFNIKYEPLVDSNLVILPPLHIKLGLIKQFVKALEKEGSCFKYLRDKFSKLSDAKVREGIFVGPQIRKLFKDENFERTMNDLELAAWTSFKNVCIHFLGNQKSENYQDIVASLLENYKNLRCRMSLKVHFLHSHLDFFPANLGKVSDEQGERFHQDIAEMEKRYQGRWDSVMMGDFCWFLIREGSSQHKRKK